MFPLQMGDGANEIGAKIIHENEKVQYVGLQSVKRVCDRPWIPIMDLNPYSLE